MLFGVRSAIRPNAGVLSNSWTQSFCHITYNDMTYIHPGEAALMHRRGNMDPVTLETH